MLSEVVIVVVTHYFEGPQKVASLAELLPLALND